MLKAIKATPGFITLIAMLRDPTSITAMGKDTFRAKLEPTVAQARLNIATDFGWQQDIWTSSDAGYRHKAVAAFMASSGDPEVDIADELGGQTPFGISQKLRARGVFPRTDPPASKWESLKYYFKHKGFPPGMDTEDFNYGSFSEYRSEARAEIKRLVELGLLEPVGKEWTQVKARWPQAIPTKSAVLVKQRPDGSIKTRLIVDMLRDRKSVV